MSEKRFELDYDDTDCVCISNFLDKGEKLTDREVVNILNSQNREINILQQRVTILREEIQSTVYILKMQTRKLEGY